MGAGSWRLMQLRSARAPQGLVSVAEAEQDVPFPIRRVYLLHAADAGAERGRHAHRKLWQLLVAASGRCAIELDDGSSRALFTLDDPGVGLLVPPMTWRTLKVMEDATVVLVMASEHFDEGDYIRSYEEFKSACLA